MNKSISKILVIGPAWVGDMVMAQTLFILLKANYPAVQIDVLAPKATHPLLACMPEVHEILVSPFNHGDFALLARYRFGRALREKHYDQAIVLPNSWKSALIPFFAKIPVRTGWRGEMRYGLLNDLRILDKEKYPLMIERFMALALERDITLTKPYPSPKLMVTQSTIYDGLKKLNLKEMSKPILALCPGAQFGPSKRWPANYFAEVADYYATKGWEVWIFGAPSDDVVAAEIESVSKTAVRNLVGQTTLPEAIALMSLATVVVTNDSGLMHIAAAVERPLIAVYGSSSPDFTPPLSTQATILTLHLECSPCFERVCPLKHFRCMLDLKPVLVIKAIDERIENNA